MRRICSKRVILLLMLKSLKIGSEKEDNKETKKALETPALVCPKTFETSAPENGGIEVSLVVN